MRPLPRKSQPRTPVPPSGSGKAGSDPAAPPQGACRSGRYPRPGSRADEVRRARHRSKRGPRNRSGPQRGCRCSAGRPLPAGVPGASAREWPGGSARRHSGIAPRRPGRRPWARARSRRRDPGRNGCDPRPAPCRSPMRSPAGASCAAPEPGTPAGAPRVDRVRRPAPALARRRPPAVRRAQAQRSRAL